MGIRNAYVFYGGTKFCLVAQKLGVLQYCNAWTEPGRALVPSEDANAFEELLIEEKIKYQREPFSVSY